MLYPWIEQPFLPDDPDRDPQETAFLRSIIDDPDDDTSRLVFADWLDENGRTDKAAFVRLEVEMSRLPKAAGRYDEVTAELLRLDEAIGGQWSWALVRPARLLNCGGAGAQPRALRFAYECPNRWADLTPTPDRAVRYCGQCEKNVYRCESQEEAEAHALQGRCVSIGSRLALAVQSTYTIQRVLSSPHFKDMDPVDLGGEHPAGMTGMLAPPSPYQLWAADLFARHRKRWWQFWR